MRTMTGTSAPTAAESSPARSGALPGLALAMLLSSLGIGIANVALPTLQDVFAASFPAVQWVVLAYLLALTVASVVAGRLGDALGRRRVMLAGVALFAAASLGCALAPTLPALIAARAVQGLGGAMVMALTVALVVDAVPPARTGSAMGLLGTMSAIGTALGPSLGGALVSALGWRAVFLVLVPLGAATFALLRRSLPVATAPVAKRGARPDVAGALVLGLALAAYALSMTIGRGHFDGPGILLLAAAGVGAGLFVLIETRAPAPLVRLATLRRDGLPAGLFANVLVAAVMMTTLVVGPFYLARALGLGSAVVGIAMSVGPVAAMLSGVPSGRIVDRFGAARAVTGGLVVMAAGTALYAILPALAGLPGYVAAAMVLAPGYQLFQAANNTAVMTGVDAGERGVVSGILGLSRNLGLVTGTAVMGAVFAACTGTAEIGTAAAEAVAGGMASTFAVATALLLLAVLVVTLDRRRSLRRTASGAKEKPEPEGSGLG